METIEETQSFLHIDSHQTIKTESAKSKSIQRRFDLDMVCPLCLKWFSWVPFILLIIWIYASEETFLLNDVPAQIPSTCLIKNISESTKKIVFTLLPNREKQPDYYLVNVIYGSYWNETAQIDPAVLNNHDISHLNSVQVCYIKQYDENTKDIQFPSVSGWGSVFTPKRIFINILQSNPSFFINQMIIEYNNGFDYDAVKIHQRAAYTVMALMSIVYVILRICINSESWNFGKITGFFVFTTCGTIWAGPILGIGVANTVLSSKYQQLWNTEWINNQMTLVENVNFFIHTKCQCDETHFYDSDIYEFWKCRFKIKEHQQNAVVLSLKYNEKQTKHISDGDSDCYINIQQTDQQMFQGQFEMPQTTFLKSNIIAFKTYASNWTVYGIIAFCCMFLVGLGNAPFCTIKINHQKRICRMLWKCKSH